MSLPSLLFVLLVGADPTGAVGAALVGALHESLGSATEVRMTANLGEGASPKGAVAKDAVATVTLASDLRTAEVDLKATSGLHASRRLAFRAGDPLAERGRAIGLVLAALVLETSTGAVAAPAASAEPPAVIRSAPVAPDPILTLRPTALFAYGLGALAFDGLGSGFGGGVGLAHHLGGSWGAHGSVQFHGADVGVAQATSTAIGVGVGVFRDLFAGLGLRLDALVLYESLTHFSSDDPEPVRQGVVLPGAAGAVTFDYPLFDALALHLAVGAEAAFGSADVYLHTMRVGTIGPLRGFGEFGICARF